MASPKDLKDLAYQHLKTAECLMRAEDWSGAAYMLGYVLEFALKSAVCRTLNLLAYPSGETHSERVIGFFKVHNFDQLQIISGTTDLFDSRGSKDAQRNWGDFTAYYLGEWPSMRYNKEGLKQFNKKVVNKIHNGLTSKRDGILMVLEKENRW